MDTSPSRRLETGFEFPAVTDLGGLVNKTFELYFDHFGWALVLTLTFFLPALLVKNICYSFTPPSSPLMKLGLDASLMGLVSLFAAPTLNHILVRRLGEGAVPPLQESFRWGWFCFPRNVGYHFVTGIMFIVGLILLVVPGILVLLWYGLLTAVVSVEGPEQTDPMARSKALVQGHMGTLFGAGLVLFIFNTLVCAVAGFGVGVLFGISQAFLGRTAPFADPSHWLLHTVVELVSVLLNMNLGVMALCGYLGWSKDGTPLATQEAAAPPVAPPSRVSPVPAPAAPKIPRKTRAPAKRKASKTPRKRK